jgi:transketolase
MEKDKELKLKNISKRVRINIIKMLSEAGSGHPGGSLSIVEILVYLFIEKIKRSRENALDENRDRFILSKGHGVPALYAILSEVGIINENELLTLRKLNSPLQGHPDRVKFPYVEASTGSLGQGLSIGLGMALGSKLKKSDFKVYVLIGDGELQEGQIWEAILKAPSLKLDNLIVFLDYNKLQLDRSINETTPLEPLFDKIKSFNWDVYEIDGHNFNDIEKVLENLKTNGKPKFIIAHTIKGKGVSFMENNNEWHGVAPTKEEALKAIKEIENG